MKIPSRANIITGALLTASLAMIVGVIYFALSIKVITNWHLVLPAGDVHAGDTIVVASTYTKLRQVTGTSIRTLECQVQQGIYLSTPLNKMHANRAPGKTGTGILVTMPMAIKGIASLPDACHVCVALTYPVLPFRTVPYFKCTKDFPLLPAPVGVLPGASQTTPSQVAMVGQAPVGSFLLPSPNDNPTSTPAQSSALQPPAQEPAPQPTSSEPTKPSAFRQVINRATGVIKSVGGFVTGLIR